MIRYTLPVAKPLTSDQVIAALGFYAMLEFGVGGCVRVNVPDYVETIGSDNVVVKTVINTTFDYVKSVIDSL